VAVGQPAKLLQLAERQPFRISDEGSEEAQPRPFMDDPIESIVRKPGAGLRPAGRGFQAMSSKPYRSTAATSSCPTPNGIPISQGERMREPLAIIKQVRPQTRYHRPTANI